MMKKISALMCIVLLLGCLSCFSSCSIGVKSADDLMEKVDAKMALLNSYESEMNMTVHYYVQGNRVAITASGKLVESGMLLKKNYTYYNETEIKIISDKLKIDESTKSVEMFRDGFMYLYDEREDFERALCSPLSAKEFFKHRNEQNSMNPDFDSCSTKEYKKNSDGTWELTYAGFDEDEIDDLLKDMAMDKNVLNAEIVDIRFTLLADKKFRPIKTEIEFVFDEENATYVPLMTVTQTYDKLNKAKWDGEIEHDDYTEVDDLRLLDQADDLLKEFQNEEGGRFLLEINQSVTVGKTDRQATKQQNLVEYGMRDGVFYYEIDATVNNQDFSITYDADDGYQRVDGVTSTKQKEDAARRYIQSLINSAGFDPSLVTDIERDGTDYIFTVDDPDLSQFNLSSMGVTSGEATLTVTFTVNDDGELEDIFSMLTIEGKVRSGSITEDLTITVTTKMFVK